MLSDPAKDFVNRALARNRMQRLRVADMLEHAWIRSAEVGRARSTKTLNGNKVQQNDSYECVGGGRFFAMLEHVWVIVHAPAPAAAILHLRRPSPLALAKPHSLKHLRHHCGCFDMSFTSAASMSADRVDQSPNGT